MPPAATAADSERLQKMEKELGRLVSAMLGDQAMGVPGLVEQFGQVRDDVKAQGERLEQIEDERQLEADDRLWVKEVRQNWASPARLILAGVGVAASALIGGLVTKWFS